MKNHAYFTHSKLSFVMMMLLFFSSIGQAIETESVELGLDGNYDGAVTITRTATGQMMLQDAETTAITLLELKEPASSHSVLTDLGADDHPQYLNEVRHTSVHSTLYNNVLPAGPDVAGNTTLGAHLTDSNMHLQRDQPEPITGGWQFQARPELQSGLLFTASGLPGSSTLQFDDGTTAGAQFSWNNTLDYFTVNHPLHADDLLTTNINGLPASGLTRTDQGALITSAWEFSEPLRVFKNVAGASASFEVLETEGDFIPTAGTFSSGQMTGHDISMDYTLSGTVAMTAPYLLVGLESQVDLSSTSSGSVTARQVGIIGHAESSETNETIGVIAALPATTAGTKAAGLLAGVTPAEYGSWTMPMGVWSGLFKGDTLATGDSHAETFVLQSGETVQARWLAGNGSPEGAVTATVGSLYSRLDGGAGTSLYVKESGSGNTGWQAK
jgi:hypothetical protein